MLACIWQLDKVFGKMVDFPPDSALFYVCSLYPLWYPYVFCLLVMWSNMSGPWTACVPVTDGVWVCDVSYKVWKKHLVALWAAQWAAVS